MKMIISLLILFAISLSNCGPDIDSVIEIDNDLKKNNQTPITVNGETLPDGSAKYPLSFSCAEENEKLCETYKDRIRCNYNKSVCYCNIEYATIKEYDNSSNYCNYEKKSQLTAFLVEFLAGFGGGHLYAKRYLFGCMKLLAYFFSMYLICGFPAVAKCLYECIDSDWLALISSFLYYFFSAGMFSWFIFDLVWFGRNNYLDGYNVPLLEW